MEKVYLHFDETEVAEANKLATELQSYLEDNVGVELEKTKEKGNTQDMGSILTIVLAAPAIVEIAKGIADWLRKRHDKTITIKDEKGEVIATNLSSKDIETILTKKQQKV